MVADLRHSFRVSFIMSDAPTPILSALELVTQVQSRPVWDGASISPEGAQFPGVHLDWHGGHGFVFQCYEDEESWSDFLVTSQGFSAPSIEVELGGQATVVFGIVGVVPNGAERFFAETGGSLREMPVLIPNRQEVDEVFNLRHTVGRKASNLLDQCFFGHCDCWTPLYGASAQAAGWD